MQVAVLSILINFCGGGTVEYNLSSKVFPYPFHSPPKCRKNAPDWFVLQLHLESLTLPSTIVLSPTESSSQEIAVTCLFSLL